MILPFPREFAEDAAERSVVDVAQARRLLASLAPGLSAALARRRLALAPLIGTGDLARVERAEAAVELAYARLAMRHGSWGQDFHAYHNEHHILEIFDSRIARLMQEAGLQAQRPLRGQRATRSERTWGLKLSPERETRG